MQAFLRIQALSDSLKYNFGVRIRRLASYFLDVTNHFSSGIVTSESMEPLARPENDHLGEGRRGEETEKNDEVVEGSENGDATLDMREERRERSGAVCDELELRTQVI